MCEYCEGDVTRSLSFVSEEGFSFDGYIFPSELPGDCGTIEGSFAFNNNELGANATLKINYCPMCGRKLASERG